MIEIDESKLPKSLVVTNDDGTKALNYEGIKTVDDVTAVLQAKDHVKNELNALKDKYKAVDIEKYNTLINKELDDNKDILQNPVYKNLENKFNDLNSQYNNLKEVINTQEQKLFNESLKDEIRKYKGVEETAIDDILYRAKQAGFSQTDKGLLSENGKTVESFLSDLKETAPHLFKHTRGLKDQRSQQLKDAMKSGSLAQILANSPIKTR